MVGRDLIALAPSSHFTPGRRHKIDTVVIHATAGRDSLAWLQYSSNPPVSCHVLVARDGTRYRIVQDKDTAWHAGYSLLQLDGHAGVNVNSRALGLEIENLNNGTEPYPEVQLESLAYQLARWTVTHGYLRWYRHSDIDGRKSDPVGLDLATVYRRTARHMVRMFSS